MSRGKCTLNLRLAALSFPQLHSKEGDESEPASEQYIDTYQCSIPSRTPFGFQDRLNKL
jgi:hypothetical protein